MSTPETPTDLAHNVSPQAYEDGLAMRRRTMGDAYVDRAFANAGPFQAELQHLVTSLAWGTLWTRPGLAPRDRSMITVAMLIAQGKQKELEGHLRGALNNGVTPDEIKEMLLHSVAYCGFPSALDAFRTAAAVLDAQPSKTAGA